jgi:hypothetical protein
MDNNNPVPPQAPEIPQPAPVVPPAQPQPEGLPANLPPAVENNSSGGHKKMFMILGIVFVVVAILIGAGFYMYTQVSKNNPDLSEQPPSQEEQSLNTLNSDINTVNIEDIDSDFSDVDKELNQL